MLLLSGNWNRLQSQPRSLFHGFTILRSAGRCSTLRARYALSTPQVVPPVPRLEKRKRRSKRTTSGGFGFWGIHKREFWFGGSKRSLLRYPEMERVRYGSPPNWEAVTLRSFRCNFFGEQGSEQGVVFAPSFVLVLGSETGIGRRASAAARFRGGLAAPGDKIGACQTEVTLGAIWRIFTPIVRSRAKPADSGGYEPWTLKRTCTGATACDSTTFQSSG